MKIVLVVVATLVGQRLLSWPGMPPWAGLPVLPMVFVVAGSLIERGRGWVYLAIVMGLGWDLLMEPLVGPGGIAWSATALCLVSLAALVADRSSRAWFAFGVAGAVTLAVVRFLALLPLGVPVAWSWTSLLVGGLLTGVWCGGVGWVRALDVPSRWRAYRARKLR